MSDGPKPGPWGRRSPAPPPAEEGATVFAPRPAATAAAGLVSTDFHAAAARNRRLTWILIAVMIAIGAVLGYLIGATVEAGEGRADFKPWASGLGFGFAVVMIAISLVWTLIVMKIGDRIVLSLSGAREVTAEQEPQLHNIVEEMAIAAGIPKPRVAVMETEALNAFATGMSTERSAVAVTRGLMQALNREELQAVVGHEMGHVQNLDVRYGTAVGVYVGLIALVGDAVLRMSRFGGGRRSSGNGKNNGAQAILMVILVIAAIVAPIAAKLVQMAISRQREYLADATSARLTRNPLALISALEKLGASTVPLDRANRATQHLFIVNPFRDFSAKATALMSTHPPLAQRIERLRNLG
ncbi:M48 family metallopeptidase [Zavarzinia compransoris]|uniref:Protease HtpX homolog n=1 Tax=Zavarzinia compransoris TaxID=1264899 RepID=A0A317EA08_9PROT|nr:M48 family metallopeptidase [Zavarzinia compransoris]PWR23769.1 zinc metalloprotease HtpX [Zavarzinia compransoris]TDP47999.1 heat shock protein HtpX [Zavarzinia compransoris]